MVSIKFVLVAATMSMVNAYTNNCKGSSLSPSPADCSVGINSINVNSYYSDGAQFSSGNCYIVYATNGQGAQKVRGQVIKDTANTILSQCSARHGIYGTNNCGECHVTINYRS